jgi:hypothetical protein
VAGATLAPNPGELIESHAMEALHHTLSGAGAPLCWASPPTGLEAGRIGSYGYSYGYSYDPAQPSAPAGDSPNGAASSEEPAETVSG